jgi:hypothetical protein
LNGKPIKKIIVVIGRIINIVVWGRNVRIVIKTVKMGIYASDVSLVVLFLK